ncbi:hypothetical protein DFQ28_002261 [Apophysomyces sp. BC1034]|nr:hypothetical protein DFQ30_002658 [Apophysomyces sp. BC1015]KAG0179332.1 hypothetical protein DFQ29_002247 [Apophysomyces sp. BC1021]KAG0190279.1 hypothetical protein DFQ28_002261 [Apophysomyces sp. BC1034]
MEFASPPPLAFASFPLVQTLAKDIVENLTNVEADIRQNTGASLVIKQFEGPSSGDRKKKANACLNCKTKKVACDGDQPCCRCKDASQDCQYPHGYKPMATTNKYSIDASETDPVNSTADTPVIFTSSPRSLSPPSPPSLRRDLQQQMPGMDSWGHFMGETSLYCATVSTARTHNAPFPTVSVIPPPILSLDDQSHLVDVFYHHVNHYFPLVNKSYMKEQLYECYHNKPSYFSPLFFYALFARSIGFTDQPQRFTNNEETLASLADAFIAHASNLHNAYLDQPHISTVLALILMANHLELGKSHQGFTRAWIWAGLAFRMGQDMGLHRQCNISNPDDPHEQLSIRVFWTAFITDRTMSMVCGRPFVFDEKDIDAPLPKALVQDDQETRRLIANFGCLIDISKIAGRVIRSNYPPQGLIRGPVKHQGAMMSTLDSWITTLIKDPDVYKAGSDNNHEKTEQGRFEHLKFFSLHTLLILLHKPYVDEEIYAKNMSPKPSLEICSYSAMIITHMASRVTRDELAYLVRSSPFILYAMMAATRVHLMNASCPADLRLTAFGEINFEKTMEIMQGLPQAFQGSMLSESLTTLQSRYQQREKAVVSGYTHSRLSSFGSDSVSSTQSTFDSSRYRQSSSSSLECETGKRPLEHENENLPPAKHTSPFKIICFKPFNSSTGTGCSSSKSSLRQPKDKEKKSSKSKTTLQSRAVNTNVPPPPPPPPEQTLKQLTTTFSSVPESSSSINTVGVADPPIDANPIQAPFPTSQTYSYPSANYTQFTPPTESNLPDCSMEYTNLEFEMMLSAVEPQSFSTPFVPMDGAINTPLDDQMFCFNFNLDEPTVFPETAPSTLYLSTKSLWGQQQQPPQ